MKSKTSEFNPEESIFTTAIEELEKLLHSETQAIVASDAEKLEIILNRKEIALQKVLAIKADLGSDPRKNPVLDELLDRILQLQQRNKCTLDNLVDAHRHDDVSNENGLRIRKIRNAYLTHFKKTDARMLDA